MQALGPSAVGEVLDDARGHAAGNAQGVADLCPVLAHGGGNAGRRAKAAENGRRVEAGRVHRLLRHEAEAAADLDPDPNALSDTSPPHPPAPPRRDKRWQGMHPLLTRETL